MPPEVGHSILHHAGMDELVATDNQAYVDLAVSLSTDSQKLSEYRQTLRDKLANSSVLDQRRFSRNLERQLQRVWKQWCDKKMKEEIIEDAV